MDDQDRRHRAAVARADFLESGEPGSAPVTDVVRASWRRSRRAGVDADDYAVEFHEDVDYDSRLVRCARPVIERLSAEMVDVPVTIALADADARIVDRLDCSTSVARVLDRVDFLKGFAFAEDGVGTNGIGTVFEAGGSVAVVGAEHFSERLVRFACTGAPILNPVSGRTEGVLDISCLAESWSPIMHTLVRSAAEDIAHRLLLDRSQAHQALFETYLHACRRRHAVMAVGSDVLMVNERAQARFGPDAQLLLQQHARLLLTSRDPALTTVTLADGRTVHLRVSWITVGPQVCGVVMVLHETAVPDVPRQRSSGSPTLLSRRDSRAAAPGRRTPGAVAGATCPAWRRAVSEARAALTTREALLVMGEPGSGRAHLLAELFRDAHPHGRVVTLDAPALGDLGALPAVDAPAHAGTVGPTLVLLRGLDRVSGADADALDPELEALGDRPEIRLAATVSGGTPGTGLPVERLLRHFGRCVGVPPLRFRLDDLAAITDSVLRDLAPDRPVRLSADAERLIVRHGWPGNVAQLREALASALAHRPVGEIRADDLPGYCHAVSTRTLTTLESSERDALIAALRDLGGNRSQAAAHLGMSRSSLYRKLERYGLTDV